MLDVCICTHNPRREIFRVVLKSLVQQNVEKRSFRVVVVDNASNPPLPEDIFESLRKEGIEIRVVHEPELGIAHARLRAIRETKDEWLLFVDDDTELMPDYLANGLVFAIQHSDVGCFGGKLLLAPEITPPRWMEPFLPYLAIKDAGEEVIVKHSSTWGPWEPPTAGAFIRRCVLERHRERVEYDPTMLRLGRQGRSKLSPCEDSLIMRGAIAQNLANAYNPALVLHHHLDPSRFRFFHLIRFMYAYGVSHVVLETLLNGPQRVPDNYLSIFRFIKLLVGTARSGGRQSIPFTVGTMAYHCGARTELLRQRRAK
jgi:hypothetical protein